MEEQTSKCKPIYTKKGRACARRCERRGDAFKNMAKEKEEEKVRGISRKEDYRRAEIIT